MADSPIHCKACGRAITVLSEDHLEGPGFAHLCDMMDGVMQVLRADRTQRLPFSTDTPIEFK